MTTENNHSEFWLDDTGQRFDNGMCIVFEGHIKKPNKWKQTKSNIHVIEITAIEELKAENERLNLEVQKRFVDVRSDMREEINQLKAQNEKLYEAHNEWSRNDCRNFGQLLIEIAQLKQDLKIARIAISDLISFGYLSQFKIINDALSKIETKV